VLEVFADSSAWFRFVMGGRSRTELQAYEAIRDVLEEYTGSGARLVTTSLVIAETHNLLLARAHRGTARRFLDLITTVPLVVVRPSEAQERTAISEWLDRFRDQDFSLTDCVSFTVMRERRITRALALDQHFAIAGFERLPQLPPGVREAVLTPTTEG
jgi:predicted nucleic acid-binding protein